MKSTSIALFVLALAAACGGHSSSDPTGGKTNWLSACKTDADCSGLDDAVCKLRVCTKVCESTDDCSSVGPDAECDDVVRVCLANANVRSADDTPENTGADSSHPATSAVLSPASSEPGASAVETGPEPVVAPTSSEDVSSIQPPGPTEPGPTEAGPTEPGPTMEVPIDQGCNPSYMDPNQGRPTPAPEECPAIGEASKRAHDAALLGADVDVELLTGSWKDTNANIELVLRADGRGTLRFGDASEYPTPAAADVTFLTPTGERDGDTVQDLSFQPQLGFPYTVIAERGAGSEMFFHILTFEAWEPWCALQEPVASPFAPSCYACMEVPEVYSFYSPQSCGEQGGCYASQLVPDEGARIHCGRLQMCAMPYYSVCTCSADECFSNVVAEGQLNWYPYALQLDPLDNTILRLRSEAGIQPETTHYLVKQQPVVDSPDGG